MHYVIVMAINVSIYSIKPFEHLWYQRVKRLWKWHAWKISCQLRIKDKNWVSLIFHNWFASQHSEPGNVFSYLRTSSLPIRLGKIWSSSTLFCTHAIRCSTYCGAAILVGLLYVSLSCQRYSNLKLVICLRLFNCLLYSSYELICSFHFWTRLWRTEFRNGTVQQIYLVVEIDD